MCVYITAREAVPHPILLPIQQTGNVSTLGPQQTGNVLTLGPQQTGNVSTLGPQQTGNGSTLGPQQTGNGSTLGPQQTGNGSTLGPEALRITGLTSQVRNLGFGPAQTTVINHPNIPTVNNPRIQSVPLAQAEINPQQVHYLLNNSTTGSHANTGHLHALGNGSQQLTGPIGNTQNQGVTQKLLDSVTRPQQQGNTGPLQQGNTGPLQQENTGPLQQGNTGPQQQGNTGPLQQPTRPIQGRADQGRIVVAPLTQVLAPVDDVPTYKMEKAPRGKIKTVVCIRHPVSNSTDVFIEQLLLNC
mgnify:FL=1